MTSRYTPIATANMIALTIAIDAISEIIGKGHGSLIPRCWLAAKTPICRRHKMAVSRSFWKMSDERS
jgi:hypothetical protein